MRWQQVPELPTIGCAGGRHMASKAMLGLGIVALAAVSLWGISTQLADKGGSLAMISEDQAVGVWANSLGAQLDLHSDGTLTASGLSKQVPGYGCPSTVNRARWSNSGGFLDLILGADISSPCNLEADVRQDGKGLDLCLEQDPDETCTSSELLRHAR